jgi:high-affinity iron transporter
MLINTILLFLQSALPMFIIISLLLLRFAKQSKSIVSSQNIPIIGLLAGILAYLLNQYMETISQLFDGRGAEFVFSLGFVLIYACSTLLFILNDKQGFRNLKQYLALVIFLLVFSLNGSHFILYLSSHWSQSSWSDPSGVELLFIGVILAVGICVSIAILLYFLLRYSDENIHINVSCYFLLFFSLGQLMQSIVLLEQVDILPLGYILWNTSLFISDNSELGQLLSVLFGYETTPSLMQFIIYLIAFCIPVLLKHSKTLNKQASGEIS